MEEGPKRELHAYLLGFARGKHSFNREELRNEGINYALDHVELGQEPMKAVLKCIQYTVEHITNTEEV